MIKKTNPKTLRTYILWILVTVAVFQIFPGRGHCLESDEILVIANRNAKGSIGIAKFYMKQRGIPEKQLLQLWLTDRETCSRDEYEKKVAVPVRRYLNDPSSPDIRCLLTIYGVPLKISSPPLSEKEKNKLSTLRLKKISLEKEIKINRDKTRNILKAKLKAASSKLRRFKQKLDRGASLDSELALVRNIKYPLSMWIPNPYFTGTKQRAVNSVGKNNVMMVSRLDGPTVEIVKRVITDSIETEIKGLKGTAYFDARYPFPGKKKVTSYAYYDKSIHLAAGNLKKTGIMPVAMESTQKLFKPGECPDAALYCGWYNLARYIDAFTWTRGSIGFHIASQECQTLRNSSSRVWCKKMLDSGVAATLGPVAEPYVQAFPVPELFFKHITEGKLSLAESYLVSLPYLSWKMVLIGDPLYTPFSKK